MRPKLLLSIDNGTDDIFALSSLHVKCCLFTKYSLWSHMWLHTSFLHSLHELKTKHDSKIVFFIKTTCCSPVGPYVSYRPSRPALDYIYRFYNRGLLSLSLGTDSKRYEVFSIIMRHYEHFIMPYDCVYNALWILGSSLSSFFLSSLSCISLSFYLYRLVSIIMNTL